MFKFVILTALVACACAAPGNLVVPVHTVVAAPAVAVAHPVATSSSHSYRNQVVSKTIPVVHAAPIVAAPLVAAHPVVAHPIVKTTHQVVAHSSPAVVKLAPVVHAAPVAVHAAPVAVHAHGLPVTSYANHYNVHSVVKSHVVAQPIALVH